MYHYISLYIYAGGRKRARGVSSIDFAFLSLAPPSPSRTVALSLAPPAIYRAVFLPPPELSPFSRYIARCSRVSRRPFFFARTLSPIARALCLSLACSLVLASLAARRFKIDATAGQPPRCCCYCSKSRAASLEMRILRNVYTGVRTCVRILARRGN